MIQTSISVISRFYKNSQKCIFQPHVIFTCTLHLQVFNFVRKLHSLPFILCYELNSVHVKQLIKRRWLDLFCNYYHIQCICNHSTALVVIFCCNLLFCHILVIPLLAHPSLIHSGKMKFTSMLIHLSWEANTLPPQICSRENWS
jgi:hypothetical protein